MSNPRGRPPAAAQRDLTEELRKVRESLGVFDATAIVPELQPIALHLHRVCERVLFALDVAEPSRAATFAAWCATGASMALLATAEKHDSLAMMIDAAQLLGGAEAALMLDAGRRKRSGGGERGGGAKAAVDDLLAAHPDSTSCADIARMFADLHGGRTVSPQYVSERRRTQNRK